MYRRFVKPALDIAAGWLMGLVLAVPLLLLALAVRLTSPGPALFTQQRVGRGRKLFKIYKFRTMRTDAPSNVPTHMLQDPGAYITRLGRFLRRSSLDELPQIWNIMRGEVSFVGPRPALWNQDDLVAERERYGANDVTPGMTGWAQVNGRDELPIPVKAELDGAYVRRMSFLFDARIVLLTFFRVAARSGVVEGTGEKHG